MTDKNVSIMNIGSMGYLPQVFKKIENEKKLNIVYLGGSITMGCNATKTELRYVGRSAKWWQTNFPDAEISYFNAGIGATTSQFGVARVQEHVLDKQPDLVFVEFSVNDSSSPLFMETYESLVRRLLKAESVKAVVLINNLFYDTGTNAQGIHNAILSAICFIQNIHTIRSSAQRRSLHFLSHLQQADMRTHSVYRTIAVRPLWRALSQILMRQSSGAIHSRAVG